jgi:preprotein translocase subunit SecA
VMNEQRRVIYKYRREILEGRDMSDAARAELAEVVARNVEAYTPGEVFEDWDLAGLQGQLGQLWPLGVDMAGLDAARSGDREQLIETMSEDALAAYQRREQEFGEELMRYLERQILLQVIDHRWREHLYEMDYLREGIHLRGFAQIDPLVAYKNEGYTMFQELMHSVWEEFARLIFHVQVDVAPAQAQEQFRPSEEPRQVQYSGGGPEQPSALQQAGTATAAATAGGAITSTGQEQAASAQPSVPGGDGPTPARPAESGTRVKDEREKIGRNDPCWCGSGKKYKKCHGA